MFGLLHRDFPNTFGCSDSSGNSHAATRGSPEMERAAVTIHPIVFS